MATVKEENKRLAQKFNPVKAGIFMGIGYLFFFIIFYFVIDKDPITIKKVLVGLISSAIAGILYSLIMNFFSKRQLKKLRAEGEIE